MSENQVQIAPTLIFFTNVINRISRLMLQLNQLSLKTMIPNKSTLSMEQKEQTIEQKVNPPVVNEKTIETEKHEIEGGKAERTQHESKKQESKPEKVQNEPNTTIRQLVPVLKNPPSSFMLFYNDNKQKISQGFPHHTQEQIRNTARALWKELEPDQKQFYNNLYNQEKKKYLNFIKNEATTQMNGTNKLTKNELLKKKIEKKNEKKGRERYRQKMLEKDSLSDFLNPLSPQQ